MRQNHFVLLVEDLDILIIVDPIFQGDVEGVVLALAEPDILEKKKNLIEMLENTVTVSRPLQKASTGWV